MSQLQMAHHRGTLVHNPHFSQKERCTGQDGPGSDLAAPGAGQWFEETGSWVCKVKVAVPVSFPGGASDKELACQCRRHEGSGLDPWVGKIP